jgi:hypothetical protein
MDRSLARLLLGSSKSRARARVLASRIGDDELRAEIVEAVEVAAAEDGTGGDKLIRDTPIVYQRNEAWAAVDRATAAIGAHLRPRLKG